MNIEHLNRVKQNIIPNKALEVGDVGDVQMEGNIRRASQAAFRHACFQKEPVHDDQRTVPVGKLLMDPLTGWCKRIDTQEVFRVSKKHVTILRILDVPDYISTQEIALQYEKVGIQNKLLLQSFSIQKARKAVIEDTLLAQKDMMPKKRGTVIFNFSVALQKISNLEESIAAYDMKNPTAFNTSVDCIHVQIGKLRKKLGSDMIETGTENGYRLAPVMENCPQMA